MVGNQLQRKAKYYFYQVQMKMYVLGLKACDFVVWTRNGIKCVEIVFDPQFIIDVRKAFGILDWSSFPIISGPADDKKCNQSEPVDDKKCNQSEPAEEKKKATNQNLLMRIKTKQNLLKGRKIATNHKLLMRKRNQSEPAEENKCNQSEPAEENKCNQSESELYIIFNSCKKY